MPKVDKSAIRLLNNIGITILGFGSQGRAQALNLRDSGVSPLIGLPSKSKSRKSAVHDGFTVATPERAIRKWEVIVALIPDHKHKEFFDVLPRAALSGKALIFAHGLSVAFGLVKPPRDCDVIMIAPHGPGVRLRERYLAGEPFTAFLAIKQDHSGQALRVARAYAAAIGCSSSNLFESTFEDEAVGDIFGEQAVLCGGLVGLLEAGFETLVKQGLSEELAYLECVHQLDLIIDLIKRYGTAGMFRRISKTAAFGSLLAKDRLFDKSITDKMEKLYLEIKRGKFARRLIEENERGLANLNSMLAASEKSSLQKTHDAIARKLNVRLKPSKARKRQTARDRDALTGPTGI